MTAETDQAKPEPGDTTTGGESTRDEARPDAAAAAGTSTVRIFVRTKALIAQHREDGESTGETIDRALRTLPTNTQNQANRRRVAAYIRDQLIQDFGDQDEVTGGEEFWRELAELQYPQNTSTVEPIAAILDHTVLTALATLPTSPGQQLDPQLAETRRLIARLLYTRPAQRGRHVVAPTEAIYTATLQNPQVLQHVDGIKDIEAESFTLDAVRLLTLVGTRANGAVLHVVHAAMPNELYPTGRPIITAVPDMYRPYLSRVKMRAVSVQSASPHTW